MAARTGIAAPSPAAGSGGLVREARRGSSGGLWGGRGAAPAAQRVWALLRLSSCGLVSRCHAPFVEGPPPGRVDGMGSQG